MLKAKQLYTTRSQAISILNHVTEIELVLEPSQILWCILMDDAPDKALSETRKALLNGVIHLLCKTLSITEIFEKEIFDNKYDFVLNGQPLKSRL